MSGLQGKRARHAAPSEDRIGTSANPLFSQWLRDWAREYSTSGYQTPSNERLGFIYKKVPLTQIIQSQKTRKQQETKLGTGW
jgi:hypothetical protein